MRTPATISALLATVAAAHFMIPALAGDFPRPAVSGDPAIVLAGGMGGGGGGMGMGGGGMGGGHFGGMSGPMMGSGQPAQQTSDTGAATDNYTYQCITSAGNCSFVAPAWMRASTLKSGAGCMCYGQTAGRIE